MTKKGVLFCLMLLMASYSMSYVDEPYISHFDDRLRQYFCDGMRDGDECNVPEIFGGVIEGVCCGGYCLEGIRECSQKPQKERWSSPARILFEESCIGLADNKACDISPELMDYLGLNRALCCDESCYTNIGECRELSGGYDNFNSPDDMGSDEMIKTMEILSCKGRAEGDKCNIPQQVSSEFNLSGVCCSGKCIYGETECTDKPDLVVSEIRIINKNVFVDEPTDYKIVIQNVGHAKVSEYFWVELRLGNGPETKYVYIAKEPEPGDYVEHIGSLEYNTPGKYVLNATVDRHKISSKDNLVDEEDEANNDLSMNIWVYKGMTECNQNGKCDLDAGESYDSCPCECPSPEGKAVCGNGCCEPDYGETHENCAMDCIKEADGLWVCGNNICEEKEGENQLNCLRDCHCGDGLCESGFGENKDNCPQDCEEDNILLYALVGFFVLLIFLVIGLLTYRIIRGGGGSKTEKDIISSPDYELELRKLNDEKKSIEEMIKLAQFKFHKRKLDEESFREIVRDQQKKLIEIEANIKDIERRITKIEEKQDS